MSRCTSTPTGSELGLEYTMYPGMLRCLLHDTWFTTTLEVSIFRLKVVMIAQVLFPDMCEWIHVYELCARIP